MAKTEGGALPRLIVATGLANLAGGVAMLAWAWLATLLTRDRGLAPAGTGLWAQRRR